MPSSRWTKLKQRIRGKLAYTQNLREGYAFNFATQQASGQQENYPHLWSEFTTLIPQKPGNPSNNDSRLQNIRLATQRINNLVLAPQQIFSFWHRIPFPSLKNGFREGPAFMNGEITKDVGGGLCLVSTNLFNTFLLGGCQIIERHNHSIDPYGERRFFPLGRDATVFYGYKDLMVRNSQAITLQLCIEVDGKQGEVQSSLWGMAPNPWVIKVESAIISASEPPTAQGMPGYEVETVRSTRSALADATHREPWRQNYTALSSYNPCGYSYY
jgi:vancomycin resistance protein VanW